MKDLITEARELCEKASPGPWYWDVIDAHKCICLESARWKVMDFARYGMNGAAPRFLVDGIMERADTLLKSIPGKEHHRGFDNYIDHPDADFIARSRTLIPELCDALEKAEERGQGCEHCQGWDTRSGAQYCPMCGKKLPVYAGTIGGEIVQHALKELGAQEGAEHERD